MNRGARATIIVCLIVLLSLQKSSSFQVDKFIVSSLDDTIPLVDSPLDIVYTYGTTGNIITWEIFDDNPYHWYVLKDGEFLIGSAWHENNETVVIDIDGLDIGIYHYEIIANDYAHNSTDEVIVSVLSGTIDTHAPFSITSDSNFHDMVTSEGWSGYGNETHPYIIEKLFIEADNEAILIRYTSVHFVIRNCTFVGSGVSQWSRGVDFFYVTNGTVENCTFLNLWVGSMSWYSVECELEGNIFGNVKDGIWLEFCEDYKITNNIFYFGGVWISGYDLVNWIHDITNNIVGGKSLGYFYGLAGDVIDSFEYGQVILADCEDVTVYNGTFDSAGTSILVGLSVGCNIEDCKMVRSRIGLCLQRSDDASIFNIEIHDASDYGIQINESVRCSIESSTVTGSTYEGILVLLSQNATLTDTTVTECGGTGVSLWESSYSNVLGNILDYNAVGILVGGSEEVNVLANRIRWNSEYGIQIPWAQYCTFYGNYIGFNGIDNAFDDGTNNYWDDGDSIGNKWSDYSGSGYYNVPGLAESIDHYPDLLIDASFPIVDDTGDLVYTQGTTGHVIIWDAYSTHPFSYEIYKDGILHTSVPWNGGLISINVDGLSVGEYNFTLVVIDDADQTASDTVMVTVNPAVIVITTTTTTTTNTTDDAGLIQYITIGISIGSVVVILIVAVLSFKSRRT
ncbi:MAG: NosD domain-containing protein [Candidatus Thorarchaeota archaeon]